MLNNDLTVSSVRYQTKRAATRKQETPALTYRKNLEADTVSFWCVAEQPVFSSNNKWFYKAFCPIISNF